MRQFLIFAALFVSCLAYGQAGKFIPSERFSSGHINHICQDKYGYIWIATDNGVNRYDGYRFTTYLSTPGDPYSIESNIVPTLLCDSQGRLWVGTRLGLARYDYVADRFVRYPFPDRMKPRVTSLLERKDGEILIGTSGRGLYTLSADTLRKIPDGYTTGTGNWYYNQMFEDSQGRFWKCGYGEEVTMKDSQGTIHQFFVKKGMVVRILEMNGEVLIISLHGISSYYQGEMKDADIDMSALGSDEVMCTAFQDRQGNILIGTRGDGLFCLDKNSRKLARVEYSLRGVDLNTAKVWSIYEDRLGNMWLGCQSKGLVIIPSTKSQFSSWSFAAQGYRISSTVTSICEGDQGMMWCTVQGNGVYGYDRRGRIVAHPESPVGAEFIYRDKKSRYWIGTDKALYEYDPLTGKSQRMATFVCEKLNDMTDAGNGNLFVSTYSRGFCIYNTETRTLKNYLSTETSPVKGHLWNNWIMAMMPDQKGNVWLATSIGVSCFDPKTESFRPYGWDCILDDMMCYSLCETKDGTILIGTEQGLYQYKPGDQKASLFPGGDGLANRVVGYIVQANDGDIWCATTMGLWQYDVRKKQFIGHFIGNGLTMKEYVSGVGLHADDDMVYFANNDGLTVFKPTETIGVHKELPEVKLTGFFIAGSPINNMTQSEGSRVAEGPVIETDHYEVSYLDNYISLEFSLLDYVNPESIIFEYRINDGEWIQNAEGRNSIQLSHLRPTTYTIEVRALSAGNYSPTKTITLRVTPPWYRSFWAYTLYTLLLIGAIILIALYWKRRTNRQLDEEKMQFLINATHDIRSPLTLIMGAAGKLKNLKIEKFKDVAELQSFNASTIQPSIEAIDRNANRLMLLVNQILDERRIDKNQLQLHCRETNMVDYVGNICKLYQYSAGQRNITFTFEHEKDHVLAWIDRIHFDKVVNNLLTNAFKFTFDGGEVKVVLRETEKDVQIEVTDNGIGLKEEDVNHLFDRFFQGSTSMDLGIMGTGIGLNLCRSITQLHGGEIKAKSLDKGALFCVTLPKGNAHLKPDQIMTDSPACQVLSKGNGNKQRFSAFRILIADDDPEIADYIISELGNRYNFDHVPNGKEALKALLTGKYDLVISDVMMPEMDGITLLKSIKDNPQISQIPVIMLTSKAEVEYKLEGLKSGADAYMAKPFNMEELHIQIDNLIDNVRRLRGKFSGAVQQEDRVVNIEVKGNDELLMERIMRSVNAHMSEADFNVDALAVDVGISRAQLHRKMKEITGISSGKFLRNLRMEQAARLLREGRINVSQVADRVGYNDQAHFSTAFKAHYSMSPSEYAEKNKKNNKNKENKE